MLGVMFAGLGHSHAQEQIAEIQIAEEIPAPPPLNLPLIAPERVPEGGNFYSAAHDWPPLPFNPLATNLNVPVYSLGAAMGKKASAPFYLFDDRAVVAAEELALAAAEADFKAKGLSRTEPPEPPTAARGVVPTGCVWVAAPLACQPGVPGAVWAGAAGTRALAPGICSFQPT